jgi:mannosyl-3-phosphoglycerate phosphatase
MKIVVFTDLDATLLDSDTYSWSPAREGLKALKERDASLVLVSSKTFAEMEPLHRDLSLEAPFVVENGGGIVFRCGHSLLSEVAAKTGRSVRESEDYNLISLGTEYSELVRNLGEISQELGLSVKGFSSMSDREVADLTGLELAEASGARCRMYDEPFLILESTDEKDRELRLAAQARGLTAVQGGRFWHLIGHSGKGVAVTLLMEAYKHRYDRVFTLGLGDSPNDFPFLELVDTAVLVGREGLFPDVPAALHAVRRTRCPGPEGWNDAVLGILGALPM